MGLLKFINGSFSYVSLQHGSFIGQIFYTKYAPLRFFYFMHILPGLAIPLKFLDIYYIFSNVFFFKNNKKKYAVSAGTFCYFLKIDEETNAVTIRLPTGLLKFINCDALVTLGRNSNIFSDKQIIGKAGTNRNLGKRPSVRGVAMNPVDHPHGGRTKTNSPEVSPWGWITKKNH